MKDNSEEIRRRIDRFKDVCRRSKLKLTHQRLEIFSEVAKSGDHPDVETVYKGVRKRMPTVSLDTVYRTLWLFMDLGLITILGTSRERVRFDSNTDSHHHFLCTQCGKACDFYSREFDGLEIPEAVKELGSVETVHVEFRGLCSDCSRGKK